MQQAIVFTDVDTVTLQPVSLPPLSDDEVLIQTAYSCISPGTELRCLAGQQAGAAFPFIPGYSLSGVVIEAGAAVTLVKPGSAVFCTGTLHGSVPRAWGGHVSHAIQKAGNVYPLPAGVDLLEAAMTHIIGISYHGMRLSQPMAHETVIVVGLGVIGQLSARLHALSGARVLGVDVSDARVKLLQEAGVEAVHSLAQAQAAAPAGADIVVDSTGVSSVLADAIRLARDIPWDDSLTPLTRLLVQGSYADSFTVPYDPAFTKQLALLIPRDAQPRDFRAVLDFLSRGKLSVRDLISEVARPDDAPRIYRALQQRELLTAVFEWQV